MISAAPRPRLLPARRPRFRSISEHDHAPWCGVRVIPVRTIAKFMFIWSSIMELPRVAPRCRQNPRSSQFLFGRRGHALAYSSASAAMQMMFGDIWAFFPEPDMTQSAGSGALHIMGACDGSPNALPPSMTAFMVFQTPFRVAGIAWTWDVHSGRGAWGPWPEGANESMRAADNDGTLSLPEPRILFALCAAKERGTAPASGFRLKMDTRLEGPAALP